MVFCLLLRSDQPLVSAERRLGWSGGGCCMEWGYSMGFLVGQRVGLGVERGSCCCRGEWGEGAPCGGLWGRNSGLSDGKFLVTPRRGRRYILSEKKKIEGSRGQTEPSSAKRAHITCAAMRCSFSQSSSRSLLGRHPLEFALKCSFVDSLADRET